MKIVILLVSALLISYGDANCGCLKCCKHLHVASPPGAPVTIIYRREPGHASCLVNHPYHPSPPRHYDFKVQAPLAVPAALTDICISKPIKPVARVDRIVMPAPHPPACHHTIIPVGQYPLPVGQCSVPVGQCSVPVGQCSVPVGHYPVPVAQHPVPVTQVKTVVSQVKPIRQPIIETLVPDACSPCRYRCRYGHSSSTGRCAAHTQQTDYTLPSANFNVQINPLYSALGYSGSANRCKRSGGIRNSDSAKVISENWNSTHASRAETVTAEVKIDGKSRKKRHIPIISSGINLLMGLLPSFIRTPIHQSLKNVKKHVDQTMAYQRRKQMQQDLYSQKAPKRYNPYVVVRHADLRREPLHYPRYKELRGEQHKMLPVPHYSKDNYMRDLEDSFLSSLKSPNYLPKLSARSRDTPKMRPKSRIFDARKRSGKKEMSPEEKRIFLMKLQKLNGVGNLRRNKRSLVFDTSELSLPYFRITRASPNDVEKESGEDFESEEETSYEEEETSYEEEDVFSSEYYRPEESSEEKIQRRRKDPYRSRQKEKLLEPLNFSHMIPHNPIFYLLNTPIRALQYIHSFRKQLAPILKSVPQVLINSKKYLKDLGKNVHSEFLDLTSNMIGDFDDDPYHYNSWQNVVRPARYRRSLPDTGSNPSNSETHDHQNVLDSSNPKEMTAAINTPEAKHSAEELYGGSELNHLNLDRNSVKNEKFSASSDTATRVASTAHSKDSHNIIPDVPEVKNSTLQITVKNYSTTSDSLTDSLDESIDKSKRMSRNSIENYLKSNGRSASTLFYHIFNQLFGAKVHSVSALETCTDSSNELDRKPVHDSVDGALEVDEDDKTLSSRFNERITYKEGDFRPEYSIVFQNTDGSEEKKAYATNSTVAEPEHIGDVTTLNISNRNNFEDKQNDSDDEHSRRKRYILQMVNEGDVESFIRQTLGSLVSSAEDIGKEPTPRRKCKSCHKRREDVTPKKSENKKYVIEKLYPKLIIDNNGRPFVEINGRKRPMLLKKRRKQQSNGSCEACREKRDDSSSRDQEDDRSEEEEEEEGEEVNVESRISNLIESARRQADKHKDTPHSRNTVSDDENEDIVNNVQSTDMPVQVVKDKIAQTLRQIQELITMDFDSYTMIYSELLSLEHLKQTVSDEWKQLVMTDKISDINSKIRLLDYFKKLQVTKDEIVEDIAQALKFDNNFMTKKLIKLLVRLQKLQCVIFRVVEDAEDRVSGNTNFDTQKEIRYIDYLSGLTFVMSRSRSELEDDLKSERDEAVEKGLELVESLKGLLELQGDSYVISEEARLLWEIKNLEKLQQDTIVALNNKIQHKQRIRKELKILFDLLRQMENSEEKQDKLLKNMKKTEENYLGSIVPRSNFEDAQATYNEIGQNGANEIVGNSFIVGGKRPKKMRALRKSMTRYQPILDDKEPIKIKTNGYTLTGYKVADGFDGF